MIDILAKRVQGYTCSGELRKDRNDRGSCFSDSLKIHRFCFNMILLISCWKSPLISTTSSFVNKKFTDLWSWKLWSFEGGLHAQQRWQISKKNPLQSAKTDKYSLQLSKYFFPFNLTKRYACLTHCLLSEYIAITSYASDIRHDLIRLFHWLYAQKIVFFCSRVWIFVELLKFRIFQEDVRSSIKIRSKVEADSDRSFHKHVKKWIIALSTQMFSSSRRHLKENRSCAATKRFLQ